MGLVMVVVMTEVMLTIVMLMVMVVIRIVLVLLLMVVMVASSTYELGPLINDLIFVCHLALWFNFCLILLCKYTYQR